MSTRDIVHIALFAALTAALGLFPPLTLPAVGVAITAQSMGPMLAGALVGAKRGGLALALFYVLVAVGMPLLAGGRGGMGVLLGASGGFVLAWPIAAFAIGWAYQRARFNPGLPGDLAILAVFGIGLVYLIGVPWISAVAGLSLSQAFIGSLGFIPGDLIKIAVVIAVTRTVRRAYPALSQGR